MVTLAPGATAAQSSPNSEGLLRTRREGSVARPDLHSNPHPNSKTGHAITADALHRSSIASTDPDRELRTAQSREVALGRETTSGDPRNLTRERHRETQTSEKISTEELEKRANEVNRAMHGGVWGLGTDEDALLKALNGLTPEQAAKLKAIYADHYGRDLEKDLRRELSGNDLDTALKRLAGEKSKGDAHALNRAMDGLGTDEKAIFDSLEGKTAQQIESIKKDYQARTGRSLENDLKRELSGDDFKRAQALLNGSAAQADAAKLGAAMNGLGTDEAAVNEVLRGKNPEQIAEIGREYKLLYGRDLAAALKDELSGDKLRQSEALMKGKGAQADAAALHDAMAGLGTDEDAICRTFQGKSAEERQAIRAAYREMYGVDLKDELRSELKDTEFRRAELLIENGELTDAQKLYFAMQGAGTDEDEIKATLEGKSKEEIEAIKREYATLDPRGLEAALQSELGGRDEFDGMQALKGEPTTGQELRDRLHAKREFETSGWFSPLVDAITDKDEQLDRSIKRLDEAVENANDDGVVTAAEQARIDQIARFAKSDTESYIEAKAAVADTAATVAATAAATAVVIGTGGAATVAVVAWAGLAGGAAYTGTKYGIQGAAYDAQDLAGDLAIGGVEGAVTAVTFGAGKAATEAARQAGKQALKDGIEQAAEETAKTVVNETLKVGAERGATRSVKEVGSQIFREGAAGGAAGDGIRSAVDEHTWENGIGAGLEQLATATAMGAASGAVGEGVGGSLAAVAHKGGALLRGVRSADGAIEEGANATLRSAEPDLPVSGYNHGAVNAVGLKGQPISVNIDVHATTAHGASVDPDQILKDLRRATPQPHVIKYHYNDPSRWDNDVSIVVYGGTKQDVAKMEQAIAKYVKDHGDLPQGIRSVFISDTEHMGYMRNAAGEFGHPVHAFRPNHYGEVIINSDALHDYGGFLGFFRKDGSDVSSALLEKIEKDDAFFRRNAPQERNYTMFAKRNAMEREAYEMANSHAPHGIVDGRPLIGRDSRITGGMYDDSLGLRIVVDPSKDLELAQHTQRFLDERIQPLLRSSNVTEKQILQEVHDWVEKTMRYDLECDQHLIGRYLREGHDVYPRSKVTLGAFISQGEGVCRHMALYAGYLVETLNEQGVLRGAISYERNVLPGIGGHAWLRYHSFQNAEKWIIDPAQHFVGPVDDIKDNIWTYMRPEDYSRVRDNARPLHVNGR
jgi:hypothetical protein